MQIDGVYCPGAIEEKLLARLAVTVREVRQVLLSIQQMTFPLKTEPESRAVFIHRDFHPTNVLWREDAVSGVVDWINTRRLP